MEELGLAAGKLRYVCSLLDRSEELRHLDYCAVEEWDGATRHDRGRRAPLVTAGGQRLLDLTVDRVATSEY
jgi:hypothetical protein